MYRPSKRARRQQQLHQGQDASRENCWMNETTLVAVDHVEKLSADFSQLFVERLATEIVQRLGFHETRKSSSDHPLHKRILIGTRACRRYLLRSDNDQTLPPTLIVVTECEPGVDIRPWLFLWEKQKNVTVYVLDHASSSILAQTLKIRRATVLTFVRGGHDESNDSADDREQLQCHRGLDSFLDFIMRQKQSTTPKTTT